MDAEILNGTDREPSPLKMPFLIPGHQHHGRADLKERWAPSDDLMKRAVPWSRQCTIKRAMRSSKPQPGASTRWHCLLRFGSVGRYGIRHCGRLRDQGFVEGQNLELRRSHANARSLAYRLLRGGPRRRPNRGAGAAGETRWIPIEEIAVKRLAVNFEPACKLNLTYPPGLLAECSFFAGTAVLHGRAAKVALVQIVDNPPSSGLRRRASGLESSGLIAERDFTVKRYKPRVKPRNCPHFSALQTDRPDLIVTAGTPCCWPRAGP